MGRYDPYQVVGMGVRSLVVTSEEGVSYIVVKTKLAVVATAYSMVKQVNPFTHYTILYYSCDSPNHFIPSTASSESGS